MALREVVGLVVRRQAVLWCDWRPWFMLASVVIPIGLLLSYATRSWGVTSGTYISIYWRFWDFSYLAVPGWRRDVIDVAVRIGSECLALVGWSWTCGFVLGRVSRRTVWLTVLMFAVVVFFGTMGTVIAGQPPENPSLQYHVVFVVLPRFFRTFLVVLPAAWGAYRGSQGFVAASRPNRAWRSGACRRNVPGLAGPREVLGLWWSGSTGSRARRIPCLRRRSASVVVSVVRDDVAGRVHPRGGEPRTRNTPSVESLTAQSLEASRRGCRSARDGASGVARSRSQ